MELHFPGLPASLKQDRRSRPSPTPALSSPISGRGNAGLGEIREFLSVDAPTSLEAGLARTALWATTVGSPAVETELSFEIERELPAVWRERGAYDAEADVVAVRHNR